MRVYSSFLLLRLRLVAKYTSTISPSGPFPSPTAWRARTGKTFPAGAVPSCRPQIASQPQSTGSVIPVTADAAGEAR